MAGEERTVNTLSRVDPNRGSGPNTFRPKSINHNNNQTTTFRGPKNSSLPRAYGNHKPPYRKLTPAEMAEKKALGLCFRCDERFHVGHHCRYKELQVLIV